MFVIRVSATKSPEHCFKRKPPESQGRCQRWLWVFKTYRCPRKAIRACACAPWQQGTEQAAMAADCTGFRDKVEHVDV